MPAFVLLRLQEKIGFDVIAVHVNHGLRGENAKRDERFTETFCRERNVPCIVYHENVKEIAAQQKAVCGGGRASGAQKGV